jgi:uncharacterized cupredoxin-like copper-binding protein
MRQSIIRTVLGVLVVFLAVGPAQLTVAQASANKKTVNVELIVDESGSMAAATDTGVLRIDAAKQVMAQVISAIPDVEGVNVGLRVYGHKGDNTDAGRPESCLSSELLVPMAGVDTTQLTAQVNALQPVGWTPLGFALEEAAKDFKEPASADVVNAIVMVTDGLETCDADPIAIAAKLHDSKAGIITHVVGFGTTPEEQTTLSEIAKSGGGQLLGSNNAGQLMDALFSILEKLDVVDETGTGETRDSPLGVGRIGKVGDYEISVLSVNPVASGSGTVGNTSFRARVSVTYTGSSTGLPGNDLEFNSVGDLSSSYNTSTNSCGSSAGGPNSVNELFPGGSAEFSVCWSIKAEDANSLLMYVKPRVASSNEAVWFSLQATGVQSGAVTAQLDVSLIDIKFEPSELTIPANTDVTLVVSNNGVLQHSFVIDGAAVDSGLLNGGQSVEIKLNLPAGTYRFYCSVAGHKEAGMVGTLTVTDDGSASVGQTESATTNSAEVPTAVTQPTKESAAPSTGSAIDMSAVDISFSPKDLTIPANTDVSVTVTNNGVLQHNFVLDEAGVDSGLLNGGESATVIISLPAGTYQFYCSVPGHQEAGMVGTLIVE